MTEELSVTYCRDIPKYRIFKMAKALKKYTNGVTVNFMCKQFDQGMFQGFYNDVQKVTYSKGSLSSRSYRIERHLAKRMLIHRGLIKRAIVKLETDIFHCLAEPYDLPSVVIKNSKKPVILDSQDFSGISSGIGNIPERTKRLERYCFENCDGIVHKGPPYEIEYYRENGYSIDCPELTYLDYCDEDLFQPTNAPKLSDEDGELHLVYTGQISPDPKFSYIYYIPLAKMLAKDRVHLHVYTNENMYRNAVAYKQLSQKEKYFHFHEPVNYSELSREVSKYDWGIWIHPVHGKDNVDRAVPQKNRVAIGNKIFSFMESGLPVVVSSHLEYGKTITERHGVGFSIRDEDLGSLKRKLENVRVSWYRKNVENERVRLSMRENIKHLVSFYRSLEKK